MPLGPVEWVAIAFPGSTVKPDVVPALASLVDSGTVHVIDLLTVHKDACGEISATELDAMSDPTPFDALDGDVLGLLSEEDIGAVGAGLAPDSTALVVVWENLWAVAFAEAVRRSEGTLLAHDRIPRDAVDAAYDAASAEGEVTA